MSNTNGSIATRFKPGQVNNPKGRPPLPPELKAITALTVDEINRVMAKYWRMTSKELDKVLASDTVSMGEKAIAKGIQAAASSGDFTRVEFILQRTVGKVTDKSEVTVNENNDDTLDSIPKEVLLRLAQGG